MANKRDDFTSATKELLAKRVQYRCSNPYCRKTTIGPSSEEDKIINIGVAAHIKAAAFGGKRFDIRMTKEERRSASNGIWLCQSCAKLIDSDARKYTVELLQLWKKDAEEKTAAELNCQKALNVIGEKLDKVQQYADYEICSDLKRMKFFVECMDRPAFRDGLVVQKVKINPVISNALHSSNMEAFEQAIQDTIIALNTGILRTRDGQLIKSAEGKSQVINPEWNRKMKDIESILVGINRSLQQKKEIHPLAVADQQFLSQLSEERQKAVQIMNSICREIGLNELEYGNE